MYGINGLSPGSKYEKLKFDPYDYWNMTPKGVILHFGKQVRSDNSFKLSHVAVTYLNHLLWRLERNNTFSAVAPQDW